MEGLLTLIVLILFLYSIGKLSNKNQKRVEKSVRRFVRLFQSPDKETKEEET